MDKHYKNIKSLIDTNLVAVRKNEIRNNYHTLVTYFNIGELLIIAQGGAERAKYGNELIKMYSIKLTEEYGKGYDYTNLSRMRQLYLYFENIAPAGQYLKLKVRKGESFGHQIDPILEKFGIAYQLFTHLSWTHFKILLPIKDENKRNYYINSTIEYGFSKRQLRDYINSNAYERLINKEIIKLKDFNNYKSEITNVLETIKDPILIAINNSVDKITEKALKGFMLEEIERFMRELGVGLAFVGSEIPIRLNKKILRPDLVFFDINDSRYIVLELKVKELTIKDIGQLEFYIKYYDADVKKPFHNPTIGITISKIIDKKMIGYNEKGNIKHITYELVEK